MRKKPSHLTYDLIRQDKFRSPEKIKTVEKLLESNDTVINWWCRQSGKTLTNIKVARDLALSGINKQILFISHNSAISSDKKAMLERAIDRSKVIHNDSKRLVISNGSAFTFLSVNSNLEDLKDYDLIIFDDFEFFDHSNFYSALSKLKRVIEPSLFMRFLNMMKIVEIRKDPKAIFSSSMKDRKNLELVKKFFPKTPITYLNWEKVNFGPGKIESLKKILSEKDFQTEYNSYFP